MKLYLLIFILLLATASLKSQTLYVTSGGTVVAQNTPVDIAANAAITSGSTALVGATVSISGNFVSGQDVLGLNGTAVGGITSSYNATTGILTLSGSASAADYQATMRKVTYTNTSATPSIASRVITFSLNAALPFTGNGHYFEFISSADISWTAANTAAIARTWFGLQGYLATITSAAENTFVYSKINAAGWLGGSDAASEGVWKWVAGPEAGTQFWQGTYIGGYPVGGMYSNWASGQPDNCCAGEHYLNYWSGDHWNDYPNVATGSITGYVVEYGGMTGDPVLHISDNVMVDFAPLVGDLTVSSGSNIKWYDAAAGGNLLASTTPLVNGNHYYASQTVNGRESTARFDVTAHVNPPPQGSLSANGPMCVSGTGTLTFTKTAGTGPYTVVYNDGTANRTASSVTSGTPFNVFTNPVTSSTTYTLVSVQDANCTRSGGFTGGPATITVNALPPSPAAGTHTAAPTQITWNWNAASGATGYKWGTTSVYADATDMGSALTKTETDLTCNTAYERYAWAYSVCANPTPVSLTQTTSACPSLCGSSIVINHVAGEVAPVSKTVTYGIVTNIPGELTKCWISSNLGADRQATAVNDATEPSAGWYWQFNIKQGFKYEGTTRTPSTTWITSITGSSDWLTVNDPCAIELGTGWRIPTYTEWNNVKSAGSWTNWNGPWNSGLKMHAAGFLIDPEGSLGDRGISGNYWSSTQDSQFDNIGIYLGFGDWISVGGSYKAMGFSVRCVRTLPAP
jgi:hypothetical protein